MANSNTVILAIGFVCYVAVLFAGWLLLSCCYFVLRRDELLKLEAERSRQLAAEQVCPKRASALPELTVPRLSNCSPAAPKKTLDLNALELEAEGCQVADEGNALVVPKSRNSGDLTKRLGPGEIDKVSGFVDTIEVVVPDTLVVCDTVITHHEVITSDKLMAALSAPDMALVSERARSKALSSVERRAWPEEPKTTAVRRPSCSNRCIAGLSGSCWLSCVCAPCPAELQAQVGLDSAGGALRLLRL